MYQEMANRSYIKSQKLQATIDVEEILQEKDRQIQIKECQLQKKSDEYLDIHNQLYKLQHESTWSIWLLKKDVKNLERDKKELEEKNQSLQMKKRGDYERS